MYFASPRFVDECKPTTALNDVINLIASDGANTDAIMQRLATLARAESSDIGLWVARKGILEAGRAVESIFRGDTREWPYLAIKFQIVPYFSRTVILECPSPWVCENHAAFYLVWSGSIPELPCGPLSFPDSIGYPSGSFRHVVGNRQWEEIKNGQVYDRYIEQDRTKDYVELLTKRGGSDFRLRLHYDRVDWFTGGQWVPVADSLWSRPGITPVTFPDSIGYPSGSFRHVVGNRQWEEIKNGQVYDRYIEQDRTKDYVELLTKRGGSDFRLRLHYDRVDWFTGGQWVPVADSIIAR